MALECFAGGSGGNVDFFIDRYASEFWASIEPLVQGTSEEIGLEIGDLKLTGVSVHLPVELVSPIEWQIQYLYLAEGTDEFGLIIDFQGAVVVSAGLAD